MIDDCCIKIPYNKTTRLLSVLVWVSSFFLSVALFIFNRSISQNWLMLLSVFSLVSIVFSLWWLLMRFRPVVIINEKKIHYYRGVVLGYGEFVSCRLCNSSKKPEAVLYSAGGKAVCVKNNEMDRGGWDLFSSLILKEGLNRDDCD